MIGVFYSLIDSCMGIECFKRLICLVLINKKIITDRPTVALINCIFIRYDNNLHLKAGSKIEKIAMIQYYRPFPSYSVPGILSFLVPNALPSSDQSRFSAIQELYI